MTTRRLLFFDVRHADPVQPSRMVLTENDGTVLTAYQCARWFRRIERDGRWFLLAGADRETGELVFLPEVELV